MAQMQAMEARLERAATPAREQSAKSARPADPPGPGPAASLAPPDPRELEDTPNSGPEQTETPMDSGLGSQMHSPVVPPEPPASASGTRAESPAALPREAARVLFGEEPILEDEYSSPREPKTRSRDVSARPPESLFREKTSPTREASVGGFSRATRARLHTAGADAALPPDVRLALRASAGGAYAQTVSEHSAYANAPRALSRLDVLAELEDVRDVNDVVVQFLAYRSFPSAASRLAERRGGSIGSDGPAGFDSRGDDSRGAVGRMTDDRETLDETLGETHESLTARSLDSVRFTFDFFDFPTVTSRACGLTEATRPGEPRLIVPAAQSRRFADASAAEASGGAEPQRAGEAWFQFTVDGRVGNGAGDAVADSAESIEARRVSFARYLAEGPPVSVDVWDGTSLLQVGTCELDVSALARRGRDAADALVEAVVRDHRDDVADVVSAVHSDPKPQPPPIGALLVRLINVGRRGGGGGGGIALEKKKASAPIRAAPDSGGELAASLRAGAVIAANERSAVSAVSASTPPRDASAEAVTTDTRAGARDALEAQETRKLARERRLREIRGAASSRRGSDEPAFVFGDARSQSRDELSGKRAVDSSAELDARSLTVRAKLLESVDAARRRAKREAVLRKLRETSEFKKTVRPRFGELCFFEHPFRNGSDREGVFEIRCDDPDIVLVTSSEDRAALRELRARDGAYDDESAPPRDAFVDLEDDAFDGNRLFLAAGESARLAFTFQSFEKYEPANKSPSDADSPHLRPRSAVIHFVDTNEGVSVHALVVDVRPRAAQTARTFRFHASEDDFWKTEIPVPVARFSTEPRRFAARASDPAVAVSVVGGDRESAFADVGFQNAERSIDERPIAVSLRAKCGAAAEPNDARTFFVNVYGDEHLATLLLTWRVTLRVAPKVDISATVGQTTRASVAVRGGTRALAGPGPRRVTAYTSRPAELRASFAPPSSPERAPLTELTLAFKPLAAGRSLDVVHLIDDSTGALAHVRLVASDARAPTPSRVFDARVAAAAPTHKKVSYSNPYAAARAFVLRSTHPELLRFRPEVLELAPAGEKGATRFFGMTFEPSEAWTYARRLTSRRGEGEDASLGEAKTEPSPSAPTEVTVFINDEQDATEECFRVRVFAAEEGG